VREAHTGERACGAIRHDSANTVARSAADWLCLAATPAFAIMALLTGLFGSSTPDIFCSGAHDASPLSGMVAMYLLMSVFHSVAWLKLIFG
jgi:CBS domain containing-hemolysin-like protein